MVPVTASPPWSTASPADTLNPPDDESPAVEIPPENVEVPVPVDTIFPPVRSRSPAVDSIPRDDLSPADEMPPVNVEVPVPFTVMRFETSTLVVEALGIMLTPETVVTLMVPAI